MTAGELRHAENHMLLLGRKTAMEKVAAFLLEMDRRLTGAGMLVLPMCRRDIGDYLGLTLETVSRALTELQTEGGHWFFGRSAPRPLTASTCAIWTRDCVSLVPWGSIEKLWPSRRWTAAEHLNSGAKADIAGSPSRADCVEKGRCCDAEISMIQSV
jgi:Crp-like helix-turn-helix domain